MKNRLGLALFLLCVVVLLPSRVPSSAQNASPQAAANGAPILNPLKVALLKWYKANTVFTTFPLEGSGPIGVAFDGANIWTANYSGGTVTKLQASDGTVLGKFSSGSGSGAGPYGVTFDGANIWVWNQLAQNVAKLRASDGTVLGTFPVPAPGWMTFDGANIWVPSSNSPQGSVYKVRASDGKVIGTFTVGSDPIAAAFDGENVWVVNFGGNSVSKLRASDGTQLATIQLRPGSVMPFGLAFDGENIWVTGQTHVVELRASDGMEIGAFRITTPKGATTGVAFDGANLWVALQNFNSVVKM